MRTVALMHSGSRNYSSQAWERNMPKSHSWSINRAESNGLFFSTLSHSFAINRTHSDELNVLDWFVWETE